MAFLWIAFACFLCFIVTYRLLRQNFKLRWMAGLFSNISLMILGACLVTSSDLRNRPPGEEFTEPGNERFYLCRIEAKPVQKSKSCIGNALLIAKRDSLSQWSFVKSRILLYFKDDSLAQYLKYGDLVVISGAIQPITGPSNPNVFNYRQYLKNLQIHCQVFLEQGRWKRVGRDACNPVRSGAERCRELFLETFRKFKVEGQDFALVSALLLGSKDFLEKDIIREFSHAGVIHVLSVSGLHVGIMYVVADKLFFFLKRGRKSRMLHHILILVFIWAYAFITGLPSSVIRAAMMFSLIAAGKMFKRSSENFNIVAVAAFIQLWINPYDITQIGFQLSYLAVFGIFAFYKPINELVRPFNKIIAWVWSILAVSMAAQLSTFPLACHYFLMFPVYFLLTNLIVVPMAAVVTYFAVSLLAIGAAGLTTEWMAWPLKWSLRFMSESVRLIQSWPGAVIEPVNLSVEQVVLVYTAIAGLFIFGVLAYRRGVFIFLGSLLIFTMLTGKYLFEKSKTSEITVYQVPGHTAIELVHQRRAIFICDSLLSVDSGKIEFQIKPNRMNLGVREIKYIKAHDSASLSYPGTWIHYPFIFYRGKKVVIIDSHWKTRQTGEIMICDLAVFSGNSQVNPEELKKQFEIKKIIIDSSVPFYRADQLIQTFRKAGITCHSVRHEGAFVLKW